MGASITANESTFANLVSVLTAAEIYYIDYGYNEIAEECKRKYNKIYDELVAIGYYDDIF